MYWILYFTKKNKINKTLFVRIFHRFSFIIDLRSMSTEHDRKSNVESGLHIFSTSIKLHMEVFYHSLHLAVKVLHLSLLWMGISTAVSHLQADSFYDRLPAVFRSRISSPVDHILTALIIP